MNPKALRINDYTYSLPDERIAHYPLPERDSSKLLVYKGGDISENTFNQIAGHLPEGAMLVFNDTRVIQARILFIGEKDTIEIFCLEPVEPSPVIEVAMGAKGHTIWKCLIGNNKKWKDLPQQAVYYEGGQAIKLTAEKLRKEDDVFIVKFSWEPADLAFSRVLEISGLTPLPPYIKRNAEDSDKERYQTVYARAHGSVAAPTAGLHFTQNVLDSIAAKNITSSYVSLHVGAGTFRPVKTEFLKDHEMHAEQIHVTKQFIEQLLAQMGHGPVIAVGTTSLRTLESLYWMGIKLRHADGLVPDLMVEQWEPYDINPGVLIEPKKAIESVLAYMKQNKLNDIIAKTALLIVPGYSFKLAGGIITNFHQPQSTLLLLIAALIGPDWKKVYNYALDNNFRFLSYGDSCLLLKA